MNTSLSVTLARPWKITRKEDRDGVDPIYLTEEVGRSISNWLDDKSARGTYHFVGELGEEYHWAKSDIRLVRKGTSKGLIDQEGRAGTRGYVCEWGDWHPIETIEQNSCGCWNKYKSHYSAMHTWIKNHFPETTVNTSKDYKTYTKDAYLRHANSAQIDTSITLS